jgi:hypothetical protein
VQRILFIFKFKPGNLESLQQRAKASAAACDALCTAVLLARARWLQPEPTAAAALLSTLSKAAVAAAVTLDIAC